MTHRHFIFLYLDNDNPDTITEHDADIEGGILQALDYAKEHIAPKAKSGTQVHIFEFRNGDNVGAIQA